MKAFKLWKDTPEKLFSSPLAGGSISIEITGMSLPSKMDPGLQAELVKAAEACGATWKWLPSGAGLLILLSNV